MTRLQGTLARLGIEPLARILGESTIQLLEILDIRNLTASRLAELVIRQMGVERILLEKSTRAEILAALPRSDAENLVTLLQLEAGLDPWSSLMALNFRRGQARTDVLFAFFGCRPPEASEASDVLEAEKVVTSGYLLFGYQRQAYREVLEYLRDGKPPRVLLHMPTGSGKTRTAMAVIAEVLREVASEEEVIIWLVHTEELCEQAAEEFEKAWRIIGDRRVGLFRHFGPYRAELDQVRGGLLVAGLQLLYRHSLTQQAAFLQLARRAALLVMDEAHQAVAPSYNHLLNLLAPDPCTPILGLSATPGRSWLDAGEDLKLADFFGRHKVTLRREGYSNPIDFLQQEGYLAKIEYIHLPYVPGLDFQLTTDEQEQLRLGLDLPDSAIRRLAADHKRNFLILTQVMKEADLEGKIILFACSVEHANVMANLLWVKGYRAAAITSFTPLDQRRHLLAQYRDGEEIQILTNYGVLTMGFDAPRTNVGVIARPTRSVVLYSQMVGRAARGPKAGGNERCRIITVVDRIAGFRSIAEGFSFWEDVWVD